MKKIIITTLSLMFGLASTVDLQAYNRTNVSVCDPSGSIYINLLGGGNFLKESNSSENRREDKSYNGIIGGALGYQFGSLPVRIEAEVTYRQVLSPFILDTLGIPLWTYMGNVYYDFHTNTSLTPYLGIGAGAINNTFENATSLGMQGKAGISYAITAKTALALEYSYLHDFRHSTVQNHSMTLNLRRSF